MKETPNPAIKTECKPENHPVAFSQCHRWSARDWRNGVTVTAPCACFSLSPRCHCVCVPALMAASQWRCREGQTALTAQALSRSQMSEERLFLLPDVAVRLGSLLPVSPPPLIPLAFSSWQQRRTFTLREHLERRQINHGNELQSSPEPCRTISSGRQLALL